MGFFPTGNISLGCDLVAGNMRVPMPATGTTADVINDFPPGKSYHAERPRFGSAAAHVRKKRLPFPTVAVFQ